MEIFNIADLPAGRFLSLSLAVSSIFYSNFSLVYANIKKPVNPNNNNRTLLIRAAEKFSRRSHVPYENRFFFRRRRSVFLSLFADGPLQSAR